MVPHPVNGASDPAATRRGMAPRETARAVHAAHVQGTTGTGSAGSRRYRTPPRPLSPTALHRASY